MTARLTQRLGTNRGNTGLIIANEKGNDEKYRGRIKMRNQVKEEENEDEEVEEVSKVKN